MAVQPATRTYIGARQILALIAAGLFFVAILCFHGTITEWSGATIEAAGLFFLTLALAVWF
jgi:hypothetical protein